LESDLTSIITELELKRAAIERALSALREIGGEGPAPTASKRRGRPPGSKNQAGSVEAGNARSEGQRRRWAEKKAAEAEAAPAAKKRRGLAAAGRKRLSEMMKARWASKNPPKKKPAK
jgi:hypothetical protein